MDTVICVYEDGTSSPGRVRYALSYDGGETGTDGTLSDSGVAAEAPAVTASGGGAVVFRQDSITPELRFRQRTDSGSWSEPVSIAEHAPSSSRPGIAYMGTGVFGVVYLSDNSPVVRGAYFDRSDWVYGIAEQRRLRVSKRTLPATVVRGVLFLPGLGTRSGLSDNPVMSRGALLDVGGRKVMGLQPGANDVSGLAPGVYFVRQASSVRRQASSVTKVVVTR